MRRRRQAALIKSKLSGFAGCRFPPELTHAAPARADHHKVALGVNGSEIEVRRPRASRPGRMHYQTAIKGEGIDGLLAAYPDVAIEMDERDCRLRTLHIRCHAGFYFTNIVSRPWYIFPSDHRRDCMVVLSQVFYPRCR